MSKKITAKAGVDDLKTRNHNIGKAAANKMIRKFQKYQEGTGEAPEIPYCFAVTKGIVTKILRPAEAIGLRIYLAINEHNVLTPVLVAFDENGKNIIVAEASSTTMEVSKTTSMAKSGSGTYTGIGDETQTCPPWPAPTSL